MAQELLHPSGWRPMVIDPSQFQPMGPTRLARISMRGLRHLVSGDGRILRREG
jgi:hypothetical protein